jgi:hypothetical protein
MLTSLSIADATTGVDVAVLHETTKRAVVTATGLYGIGSLRDSKRVRPQAHGGINETRYSDGKLVTLEAEVFSNVSLADAYTEWRLLSGAMVDTLDVTPALIKWSEPSGLNLQRLVKLDSLEDPKLEENAAILRYQVSFFAEDYRAYSQTRTTVTSASLSTLSGGMVIPFTFPFVFAPSGGATAAVTNAGNRPTPPTFRIYGGVTNPQIVLVGGARLALNGTIAAGDYLEVGTDSRGTRYVKLFTAGSTVGVNRLNFYDGAASTWFDLPVGASSLQMVAGSFDASAHFDVLYRGAYA